MIATVLDRRLVRVALAACGVPVTLAALIAAAHDAVLLIAGIQEGEIVLLAMGAAGVFGSLGLVGAWWRVLRPCTSLSARQRTAVRTLLVCGVGASGGLAAWSFYERELIFGLMFAGFAAAGAVFFRGTPSAV